METFGYIAIDLSGKERKGSVRAESSDRVREQLKNDGLLPVSIDEQNQATKALNLGFLSKKPSSRDLSVFCRQFVSIIEAGVPVISALDMLADQTGNKLLAKTISETKMAVEKGESLTSAMGAHKKVYTDMFVTLVEAGEASGSLTVSFQRMAEQFEKDARLKAMMKKATIYPIAVFVVAVGVVIGMLAFVIPTFEEMFADLGTELPGITRAVIAASAFVQNSWYVLIAIVIALFIGTRAFAKTVRGQRFFGKILMKLPLFGPLTVKTASSRLARTLSTLLAAGLPLVDALDITADTMSNIHFRDAVRDTKDSVAMGTTISEPLTQCGIFPPLVHHMVGIGEETGNIEGMLNKLADYYDEEVEAATQALMAAMEPMIIIVLAGAVGTIIMSIILPMAQMYTSMDSL